MLDQLRMISPVWFGRSWHRPRLDSIDDWSALAARYGDHPTARSETVKFVVDLFDSARTYFFDSNRFNTHYRFVQQFIDPRLDQDVFLRREYSRKDRRFVSGSVVHYLDGEHWTLELSCDDTLEAERIVWLVRHIASRMRFRAEIRFRPVSQRQIAALEAVADRLPAVSREAIHATLVYQPIVLGEAFGRLVRVRGPLDVSAVRPYDVVITDEVPNEIAPVAALITSQLQAPLAHVAVLCRSRNTPDMAHRGAIDLALFKQLEGEIVKLTVGGQDFKIEKADPAQAEAAWSAMRPAEVLTPDWDHAVRGLFDVDALPHRAARFAGAKAAQLGALCAIDGIATPGGFVLPFAAYRAHLESAGLVSRIDAMLDDEAFRRSAVTRAEQLAEVRANILSHPVDAQLLARLEERLRASDPDRRWIFRSSSNAEDLPGFSGAGLYESTIAPAAASTGQIADALRRVWAGVWLQRAFEERDWYRIDHRAVAMAVLVQPCFDEAIASGVAISANPFKSGKGALINAQVHGHTVTGALGNELPEQVLVTTWSGVYEFELLNRSSLARGELILLDEDLQNLSDQLFTIHDRMLPLAGGRANAMDVEFVLTRERKFVIVQARPYQMVYNVDRGGSNRDEGRLPGFIRRVRRVAYRFLPNRLAYRPPD